MRVAYALIQKRAERRTGLMRFEQGICEKMSLASVLHPIPLSISNLAGAKGDDQAIAWMHLQIFVFFLAGTHKAGDALHLHGWTGGMVSMHPSTCPGAFPETPVEFRTLSAPVP